MHILKRNCTIKLCFNKLIPGIDFNYKLIGVPETTPNKRHISKKTIYPEPKVKPIVLRDYERESATKRYFHINLVYSTFPIHVQALVRNFETNEPVDLINISRDVFGARIRRDLIHSTIMWERRCLRTGTHCTKTRAEVRGGGRKPWAQKHTGKPPVSSIRAPQFVGGGRAHGAKPKDYSHEYPTHQYLAALRSMLSAKYAQNQLVIFDQVLSAQNSHKTKHLYEILNKNNYLNPQSGVFLLDYKTRDLHLASRNIPNIHVQSLDAPIYLYKLLLHHYLFLDRGSLLMLEHLLKNH